MSEEINSTTTVLNSLQTKVERLEVVNKELAEKLLKQNESIERMLTNINSEKSNAIVPVKNQEQEQSLLGNEDPEQASSIAIAQRLRKKTKTSSQ
jgi:hypothetical protein